MNTAGSVNTVKTARRTLRFETIEQALAEARRIAALDQSGQARCSGNWSVGQILNHVAAWAEFAFTGPGLKAPWFVRTIMPLFKNRILSKGLPAGKSIPHVPGGTLATEEAPTERALERFEKAFIRLGAECPVLPNVIFGPLTHQEWIALNLRHAELHMGFVK